MKIYEKVQRFHQVTGKPVDKWAFKEIRCDFTGEVIDIENYYCTYNLNYEDQDPCAGSSGSEYEFSRDFGVDVFQFLLNQHYHFFSMPGSDVDEDYAEAQMMKEALENCNDDKSEWYRCFTFDAMCRTARIRTARRLIKEKIITPEQLNHEN